MSCAAPASAGEDFKNERLEIAEEIGSMIGILVHVVSIVNPQCSPGALTGGPRTGDHVAVSCEVEPCASVPFC
jgi:hypothetical protein